MQNIQDIKAVVLAAGVSKRLWPFKDKHFVDFLGKPLIYHSLGQLYHIGIKNFIIVVNKDNQKKFGGLQELFPDGNFSLVEQEYGTGMGGAILSAKKQIAGNRVLVLGPSDVFENIIFSEFKELLRANPNGILSGKKVKEYFPGGYLKVNKGDILGIKEKPKPEEIQSHLVTFVFDYFKESDTLISALEQIERKSEDSFERAVDLMVKQGSVLKLLQYNGFWGYLKYPWNILDIMNYYLSIISEPKYHKQVTIASSAVVSGNVYLEEGVKVLENAKIIGPAYIGKGTVIGNNTMVRESMIGERCVVGFGTEIARSYLGNNCWFHTNYLGDCVVGNNVSMGAGSVAANFRLDEGVVKSRTGNELISTGKVKLGSMIGDNTRIGINTSIMPGIKIGSNSVLGPAVLLDKDLPDNKYCYKEESSYIVRDNRLDISNRDRQSQRKVLKFG